MYACHAPLDELVVVDRAVQLRHRPVIHAVVLLGGGGLISCMIHVSVWG